MTVATLLSMPQALAAMPFGAMLGAGLGLRLCRWIDRRPIRRIDRAIATARRLHRSVKPLLAHREAITSRNRDRTPRPRAF